MRLASLVCVLAVTSCTTGTEIPPTPHPGPRVEHAMAYDAARGEVLLFGGSNGGLQVFGDLWAWDGSQWALKSTSGPAARMGAILAFNPTTQHMMLYGGSDASGTPFTDLWDWDGMAWTELSVSGGPPIKHAAGGFDAHRNRLVVHRGYSGTAPQRDTWEWDGTAWTQAATATPQLLSIPLPSPMVYEPSRQALLMLIGDAMTGQTVMWQWSGTAWTDLGPGPAMGTPGPIAIRASDNIIALDGNPANVATAATWRWNGTAWGNLGIAGPAHRLGGAMAYDVSRNQLVMYGGQGASGQVLTPLGDTWTYSGTSWDLR